MKNQDSNLKSKAEHDADITLESLSGIKRQPVSGQLLEKLNAIPLSKRKIIRLNPQLAWRIAACLAIMILLNVFTILNRQKKIDSGRSPFANEYFSYMKTPSI